MKRNKVKASKRLSRKNFSLVEKTKVLPTKKVEYIFKREKNEVISDSERCDIKILNLHYLLLARDLCRHDQERAQQIVGIPTRYHQLFADMTFNQVNDIACSTSLLFSLRFKNNKFWESAVKPDSTQLTNVLAVALSLGQQSVEFY